VLGVTPCGDVSRLVQSEFQFRRDPDAKLT